MERPEIRSVSPYRGVLRRRALIGVPHYLFPLEQAHTGAHNDLERQKLRSPWSNVCSTPCRRGDLKGYSPLLRGAIVAPELWLPAA